MALFYHTERSKVKKNFSRIMRKRGAHAQGTEFLLRFPRIANLCLLGRFWHFEQRRSPRLVNLIYRFIKKRSRICRIVTFFRQFFVKLAHIPAANVNLIYQTCGILHRIRVFEAFDRAEIIYAFCTKNRPIFLHPHSPFENAILTKNLNLQAFFRQKQSSSPFELLRHFERTTVERRRRLHTCVTDHRSLSKGAEIARIRVPRKYFRRKACRIAPPRMLSLSPDPPPPEQAFGNARKHWQPANATSKHRGKPPTPTRRPGQAIHKHANREQAAPAQRSVQVARKHA